jgi:hypothetical protein
VPTKLCPELERFVNRELEDPLQPRGEERRTRRRVCPLIDDPRHFHPDCLWREVERLEGFGSEALAFADEAEQEVLGVYEAVVENARLFLCQAENPSRPVRERPNFCQLHKALERQLSVQIEGACVAAELSSNSSSAQQVPDPPAELLEKTGVRPAQSFARYTAAESSTTVRSDAQALTATLLGADP